MQCLMPVSMHRLPAYYHSHSDQDLYKAELETCQTGAALTLERAAYRIQRDVAIRGRDVASVIEQYTQQVKPAFDQYVAPSRKHADVIIPWVRYASKLQSTRLQLPAADMCSNCQHVCLSHDMIDRHVHYRCMMTSSRLLQRFRKRSSRGDACALNHHCCVLYVQ